VKNQLAAVKGAMQSVKIVEYLTPDEVKAVVIASNEGRHGSRDSLLVKTLFETGLRVSEALSLIPKLIDNYEEHAVLFITGKGNKPRMVAYPDDLAHETQSFAYLNKIGLDQRIWDINRQRAWQIVKYYAQKAGIKKKVYPHPFRHSDAIERLRLTGNPKALQYHLGYSSPLMTMRYLTTLTAEDALKIQQAVKFDEYDNKL
jgi:integrase/recombinase XerD